MRVPLGRTLANIYAVLMNCCLVLSTSVKQFVCTCPFFLSPPLPRIYHVRKQTYVLSASPGSQASKPRGCTCRSQHPEAGTFKEAQHCAQLLIIATTRDASINAYSASVMDAIQTVRRTSTQCSAPELAEGPSSDKDEETEVTFSHCFTCWTFCVPKRSSKRMKAHSSDGHTCTAGRRGGTRTVVTKHGHGDSGVSGVSSGCGGGGVAQWPSGPFIETPWVMGAL